MIDYYETKQHPVTKKMVLDAYKKVRANKGSAGIDEQDLESFGQNAAQNLYKIWNRMSSGSYYPPAVKEVRIPKKTGGTRPLGIPTVSDRIAQQVVKSYLEPKVEGSFHPNSYGYRPHKSAHQALEKATNNCAYYSWVVDLDIKGFFDNIDHELMMRAVRWYTKKKWVVIYIERWLKAGVSKEGKVEAREKGTPQGGVISPLLANIYLHFAFDKWMQRHHAYLQFERYCDDIIVHCTTEKQAEFIREAISKRLRQCRLELNDAKTHIVYCQNHTHTEQHKKVSFDFLGYTFRPLRKPTKNEWKLMYFPCMSSSSKKEVRRILRKTVSRSFLGTVQELARILNPKLRGWLQYYGKYAHWTTRDVWYWLNEKMVRWIANTRKASKAQARRWLRRVFESNPRLFEHWSAAQPY